ncbi:MULTISPECIES: hypothetical protein [Agrobacterium]|uniref:Uncharacterized protein n=1 Tax=Agrobacterium tumefaciens TaxID=358 RepID=A0AAE6BCW9_AGRTU|nr:MULTISPECIES: hypothetical protein [Agrobacterium]QCL75028.1 hypothetical protein CFBP5499_15985 [Agrobacterium tumefaciens]QCL80588.1 hypothetical protein CFBP5877_15520 [Agrobacterium tumefaciens]CUX63230.1 membrane hypothetical protein [Agrobacterium sp. NCPPB 925]
MSISMGFSVAVALFQLTALYLGGADVTLSLAGVVMAFSLGVMATGDAVLRWVDMPIKAHLPAAFVIGYGIVSVTLFVLSRSIGLSPLTGILLLAVPALPALVLFARTNTLEDLTDLGWLVVIAACIGAIALSAICSPIAIQTRGILTSWYDFFLHGISIQAFASFQDRPSDPEMVGATLVAYHYAPFLPPAAIVEATRISGLMAATANLLPLGLLVGALGLYALVTQLADRSAAIIALALLVVVPDPADYMLRSGWFDVAWLLFGSPGSGYGMGLCFIAASCLAAALSGVEHRCRILLLCAGLALIAILERVQMFMLLAPPLFAVWLWAVTPRRHQQIALAVAVIALALPAILMLLPDLRAEWLAWARVLEYMDLAVTWSEHYGQWVAPWIGTDFAGRAAQLVLIVALSLGVFLLAAPVAAFGKLRRVGAEPMDLLPPITLSIYVLLILFAPPGGNGDSSEYKHRHFVELYWLFVGFTAAWLTKALPPRSVRPLAGLSAIAAGMVCGLLTGRPIDAPNVVAMPWARAFHSQQVTKGIPEAAIFLAAGAKPSDVLAADAATSQERIGPLSELMGLVDVQAYLARGDLKALRSNCHAAAVADRLSLLKRVDAAKNADVALGLLSEAGIRYFLPLSGLPRWDAAGAQAAFLTGAVAVYIVPTSDKAALVETVCP